MLSRAAERVYWTGRYLERAENTARIVQQYSQLLLDLPQEVGVEWQELVEIFGAGDAFAASGAEPDETAILNFLVADSESATSLAYSIRMARDNIRNLRDLLPQESWETVNELYRLARENLALSAVGENRFEVLSDCIGRCQQVNGVLVGTMSHRSPFHFLTLGQSLERADMTSRIIDVAAAYLQQNEVIALRFGSTLWTNVLKSVSAFQMYRQYRQPQVEGSTVIDFLLRDDAFPRAIQSCIRAAGQSAAALPNGEKTIAATAEVGDLIRAPLSAGADAAAVSTLMDDLQQRLARAHSAVAGTWFLRGDGG